MMQKERDTMQYRSDAGTVVYSAKGGNNRKILDRYLYAKKQRHHFLG
jgi:hypothetical protein